MSSAVAVGIKSTILPSMSLAQLLISFFFFFLLLLLLLLSKPFSDLLSTRTFAGAGDLDPFKSHSPQGVAAWGTADAIESIMKASEEATNKASNGSDNFVADAKMRDKSRL